MSDLKRLIALVAKNFALTAVCLAAWLALGYVAGSAAARAREPTAARYIGGTLGGISNTSLDRYYAVRDAIVLFAAYSGVLTAQAVFIVAHVAGRETAAAPPGGFPIVTEAHP